MALISLRQLLDHAAEHSYGVPAFNVNNLEQVRAIMMGADELNSPVILQASAGARKYAGSNFLKHLILAAIEEFPHIPIVMHQDHGVSPGICQRSIQLGFSSVMMDGSLGEDGKTPADYDYNVDVTRFTVKMAHACGVSVEGELGCLGSLETGMAAEEDGVGAAGKLSMEQLLTDPEEAAQFVEATQVDALAIAVGTSHGAYKFSRPPTGDILAISRIKEIHQRIPNTHLVMHGSSSVPQEWLAVINEFSRRLERSFREIDLVARIGGDEFVVLLDDNPLKESVSKLLARLEDTMREPFILGSKNVRFKYSLGKATFPQNGTDASSLLNHADQQMYFAKKVK